MNQRTLIIEQTIYEYKKYKELELKKAEQEQARENYQMKYYHLGRADGMELLLSRLEFIKNLEE
tara:strand:- start:687 stop:878 length:192 start_codon:yes stop_codon:yes gene_type:complete